MQGGKQHFWIDRRHDRVGAEFPCQVGTGKDALHTAQVLNLSAGGLKFCCSQETIQCLLPEGQQTPGLVTGVSIHVQFRLTLDGRKTPARISTTADIIHTERLAQDIYHVGIQFTGLGEDESKALQSYINENQPAK